MTRKIKIIISQEETNRNVPNFLILIFFLRLKVSH